MSEKAGRQVKVKGATVRHSQRGKIIVYRSLSNKVYEDPPTNIVQLSSSYMENHIKRANEILNVADSRAVSTKCSGKTK